MSQTSYRVDFFRNENINNPPAVATRKVSASQIISATLNWSLNFDAGVAFDGIRFNGASFGDKHSGSADVTSLMILNGNNDVRLDYSRWIDWIGKAGVATVSLDVIGVGVTQSEAPKSLNLSQYKWWIVGAIVLLVLIVFLTRTGVGGKVVSAAYGTAKDAVNAVTGAVA